ncbi:LCP family protein [Streptomyces sp. YC504]|uniref:LCP family protein n=1 Tax=Streptomyces mesophilus TaxID=1775132 RepID=A0A6G4XCS3_9ACTN|nr:LCP family protein [Streptomyces mesophilus]NGO74660.1 LCP family protein [Streptomyces mesophilus]
MPHQNEHPAQPAGAPPAPGYGPPRLGRSRHKARKTGLRYVAWGTLALLLATGGGVAYAWQHLDGNIKSTDLNAALGQDRPDAQRGGAQNILLLGSDSRAGTHGKYGQGVSGARADTAMVLHVDKSHQKASVVSIPRDTMVERPACTKPGGDETPGAQQAMFNSSYAVGGPACTVKTVEKMSGLRMDHYLEVDFKGFQKLIDELGGVDITTRKAIDDPNSGLSLTAGKHRLNGEQALALVRTRHGVGDGSDLGRIQLQQAFVKALIHRAHTVDPLGSPAKSYALADTATKSISADSDLASADKLLGLAKDLKDISPERTRMVTLPVTYDAQDAGRVLPLDKASHQVWTALRQDRPVPESATSASVGDKADTPVKAGS